MMKARFFRSKYQKIFIFYSFYIWLGIKDFYNVVLENTYWTVRSGVNINFWNDLPCSSRYLSLIAGVPYTEMINLSSKVYEAWNKSTWSLHSPLANFTNVKNMKNIVPYTEMINLSSKVYEAWNKSTWSLHSPLANFANVKNMKNISISQEEYVPNWMLENFGILTQKFIRCYISPMGIS